MGVVDNSICKTIQFGLNDYLSQNPENKFVQKGVLDALVSDMNKPITPQVDFLSRNENGNITFRSRYWQGLAEGAASAVLEDVCVPGTPRQPRSQDYTLSQVASHKFAFKFEDFRDYCKNETIMSRLSKEMMQGFDRVLKAKSDILAAQIFGLNLPYAEDLRATPPAVIDSNAAPKTLPFFTNFATGQISPVGIADLSSEFAQADFTEAPITVGRGYLWYYTQYAKIACCNSTSGVDNSQNGEIGDMAFFEDRNLGGILGDPNAFLAWNPGWLQTWSHPRYTGQYATELNEYDIATTIIDPRSGEAFDFELRLSGCKSEDRIVTGVISQNFDLFSVPNDIYDAADPLSGYRGAVQFIAG